MHVLNFFRDDEDIEAAIFASDEWRAAEIWKAIDGRFSLMPEGWLGSELESWLLFGRKWHEREACERCVEGIGVYSLADGWTILPICYPAIGLAPPERPG